MILIFKGIIIGIGKILPGISGSLLAINMGEYDNIIESISNIKNNPKKTIPYLTKLGIGIILAITLLSKIIVKCLNTHYCTTMLLFIGIIVGEIIKRTKKNNYSKIKIALLTLTSLLLLLTMTILNSAVILPQKKQFQFNINLMLMMIIMGAIDAFASIVPGISGTALLIMFGYYNIIIKTFSNIFKYTEIKNNICIIVPFGIGFITNTYLMSKIITKIKTKYPNKMSIAITILMIITILIILKQTLATYKNSSDIIIGIPLLLIGIYAPLYIDKKHTKKIKE